MERVMTKTTMSQFGTQQDSWVLKHSDMQQLIEKKQFDMLDPIAIDIGLDKIFNDRLLFQTLLNKHTKDCIIRLNFICNFSDTFWDEEDLTTAWSRQAHIAVTDKFLQLLNKHNKSVFDFSLSVTKLTSDIIPKLSIDDVLALHLAKHYIESLKKYSDLIDF
jgi:hypothetical protein